MSRTPPHKLHRGVIPILQLHIRAQWRRDSPRFASVTLACRHQLQPGQVKTLMMEDCSFRCLPLASQDQRLFVVCCLSSMADLYIDLPWALSLLSSCISHSLSFAQCKIAYCVPFLPHLIYAEFERRYLTKGRPKLLRSLRGTQSVGGDPGCTSPCPGTLGSSAIHSRI